MADRSSLHRRRAQQPARAGTPARSKGSLPPFTLQPPDPLARRALSDPEVRKALGDAVLRGAARAQEGGAPALRVDPAKAPDMQELVTQLLASVVRSRDRLMETDARYLMRSVLPGKLFDLVQAVAVDSGLLQGCDGEHLYVTAKGRKLPGVMPPNARTVAMVEGASWANPSGPTEGREEVISVPPGGDLLRHAPAGRLRRILAQRVGCGELAQTSGAAREIIVQGTRITVRGEAAHDL